MGSQLGRKLKELRREKGWTQYELARQSGVKRGYLASIEAGLVENPSAPVFLKLAGALGVSPDSLYEAAGYVGYGRAVPRPSERLDDIIDQLRAAQPTVIPLYRWDDFPGWKENDPTPLDYIYRAKNRASGRKMTAYVVRGTHYEPLVGEDDIIVVDREEPLDDGEMVACRIGGVPTIGTFRTVDGEHYVETADGRTRFEECEEPVEVVEIRRWLEERDRRTVP